MTEDEIIKLVHNVSKTTDRSLYETFQSLVYLLEWHYKVKTVYEQVQIMDRIFTENQWRIIVKEQKIRGYYDD